MRNRNKIMSILLAAAVAVTATVWIDKSVYAVTGIEENEEKSLAEKYPLEAVRQHAVAVAEEMDVPENRLYGIITYGGEDYLITAEEHKEKGHYGVEYIHTYVDTDGVDAYEPGPVDLYFKCPVCGSVSCSIIPVEVDSTGRVFWCKCDDPWIIGITIAEGELRDPIRVLQSGDGSLIDPD